MSDTLNVRRHERDGEPLYVAMFGVGRGAADNLVDAFKRTAAIARRKGYRASAYQLWRAAGLRNPLNVRAGQQPKTLYVAMHTRAERQERARRAGLASMHGTPDGSEGEMASARGKHLAERRWRGANKGKPLPWAKK